MLPSLNEAEKSRRNSDRGAVVIFATEEKYGRIALVYDAQKEGYRGEPAYWKLPGGKIDPGDRDEKGAALRELEEETGLESDFKSIQEIASIDRGTHKLFVFVAVLPDFSTLRATGDEGEVVRAYSLEQVRAMKNFFPNHHRILEMVEAFLAT